MARPLTRRRLLAITGGAVGTALIACQEQKAAEPTPTPTGAPVATPASSPRPSSVFNVRDFGAKADGSTDDSKAINATIQAAIDKGAGASVLLPAGRYLLATPTQTRGQSVYTKAAAGIDIASVGYGIRAHVLVKGASGLSISGEPGTTLVMRDATASGIYLDHCTATVLSTIAVDYDPLPFTQGVIAGVDAAARSFDFKLDTGYPEPTAGYLGQALAAGGGFGLVYTQGGDLKPVGATLGAVPLASIGARPSGTWRFQSTATFSGVATGDRFAWTGRRAAGGHAVVLKLCRDCRVETVTVHSAPTLAFLPEDCDSLTFRGCVIEVPKGSERLLSANADGIHCKSNKRGPLIDGCRFSRNGDDVFTIVQFAQAVFATPSPTELVVDFDQYQLFEAGDRIAVIDQTTGLTRAEAAVRDVTIVSYRGARARQLSLDAPLAGLVSVDSLGLSAVPAKPLSSDRTTPLNRRPDLVADLDRLGSGFVIRNNVFADHFAGARIYANDGLVENNEFRNFMGNGLLVGMALLWPEVFDARKLTIRNNTFSGISNASNVFIRSQLGGTEAPGSGMGNQDITIEGNTFVGYGALPAIRIDNGQNVRIRGNSFGPVSASTVAVGSVADTGAAVSLDRCKDITVEDNTITQGAGANDGVVLSARTDKTSVTVRNNRIVAAPR